MVARIVKRKAVAIPLFLILTGGAAFAADGVIEQSAPEAAPVDGAPAPEPSRTAEATFTPSEPVYRSANEVPMAERSVPMPAGSQDTTSFEPVAEAPAPSAPVEMTPTGDPPRRTGPPKFAPTVDGFAVLHEGWTDHSSFTITGLDGSGRTEYRLQIAWGNCIPGERFVWSAALSLGLADQLNFCQDPTTVLFTGNATTFGFSGYASMPFTVNQAREGTTWSLRLEYRTPEMYESWIEEQARLQGEADAERLRNNPV